MRKLTFCLIVMTLVSVSLHAQHTVNDVAKYGGWFKVKIEISQSGKVFYFITQCYPSGEEYEVVGAKREELPLYLKVLCMTMMEGFVKDTFDFDDMIFEEEGYFIQLDSFSFTMIFKFSKSEAEILDEIGDELVNQFRYKRWP